MREHDSRYHYKANHRTSINSIYYLQVNHSRSPKPPCAIPANTGGHRNTGRTARATAYHTTAAGAREGYIP